MQTAAKEGMSGMIEVRSGTGESTYFLVSFNWTRFQVGQ